MKKAYKIFAANKQFGFLFAGKMFGQSLKFIMIVIISSSFLSLEEFGMFSLYLVLLNFVYLVAGFGVIDTAMYLINKKKEKEEFLTIGYVFIVPVIIIFIVLSSFTFHFFGFADPIFLGALSSGYVLQLFIKKIAVSLRDFFTMYYFEGIQYLCILLFIFFFTRNLNEILIAYASITLITSLLFLLKNKITYRNFVENTKEFLINIKFYGLRVHFSQVISLISYDSDKLILEKTGGVQYLGIYSLSMNFIMPVKLLSISISELMFKKFSDQIKIDKKVLIINAVLSFLFGIILTILGKYVLITFYNSDYQLLLDYLYYLPFLALLNSFYTPINYFFTAKGMGKEKLLNAVVLAITSLILYFSLIPIYGISGAYISSGIALLINNLFFVYQYRKYLKENT